MSFFKSWLRVCFHPWAAVFRDELSRQSILTTWLGVAAGALLGLGLSWLAHLLSGQPPQGYMGIASIWVEAGTPAPFTSWSVIAVAGVILGFLNFEIVLFIFARLLGGKGSFGAQAFVQSLFYAPLAVIQQVFAVAPLVGHPLFFLFAICSLLPTTTSLMAAHGYSLWRAIVTWLLPIVLNVVVVYVVVMILIARG